MVTQTCPHLSTRMTVPTLTPSIWLGAHVPPLRMGITLLLSAIGRHLFSFDRDVSAAFDLDVASAYHDVAVTFQADGGAAGGKDYLIRGFDPYTLGFQRVGLAGVYGACAGNSFVHVGMDDDDL